MEMFSSMGDCFALDEEQINISTAVTGPAPVLAFFEAIIESSVLLGIDRTTSEKMVYKTLEGCLKMWEQSGDLSKLLVQTSTPAGISVKQNYELEKGCFKATVKKCYEEGYLKTKKFSDTLK
jgi:pyrroline-5-carboxylate reductase